MIIVFVCKNCSYEIELDELFELRTWDVFICPRCSMVHIILMCKSNIAKGYENFNELSGKCLTYPLDGCKELFLRQYIVWEFDKGLGRVVSSDLKHDLLLIWNKAQPNDKLTIEMLE